MNAPNTSSASPPVAKKEYHAPKLTVYGGVRELTGAVGAHGQLDGGAGRTSRSHA
jgi:hypothetical protein